MSARRRTRELIDAGVDAVKVGIGPAHCTTRVVTCAGGRRSRRFNQRLSGARYGVRSFRGGVKFSVTWQGIAAGADVVMIGSLFAEPRAPGEVILYHVRSFRCTRHGSIGAMREGSSDRYSQTSEAESKLVPEGIEVAFLIAERLRNVTQLVGASLRHGLHRLSQHSGVPGEDSVSCA